MKGLLIYQRIILIQFIAVLIIMTIFSTYLYFSNFTQENTRMKKETEQLRKRLADNLSTPIWNIDNLTINKLLTQEITDTYIKAILINDNKIFITGKIKNNKGQIEDIEDISKVENELQKYPVQTEKIIYKDEMNEKEMAQLSLYITDESIKALLSGLMFQSIIQTVFLTIILGIITFFIINILLNKPLKRIIDTAIKISQGDLDLQAEVSGPKEITTLAISFNTMTNELKKKADSFKKANETLSEIIGKSKEMTVNLNSSLKEIEALSQEQTSATNEHASGITEVTATLEELTITAKQITKNVSELVLSSEEAIKALHDNGNQLTNTVSQLDEVGNISKANALQINELGKRSSLINEMVELIKEVANKTNILSINASIEASRSGEAGAGFSVVAAEIRELSKETINSAKNVEKAAKEIQEFLNSIIISSESESTKVISSAKIVKSIFENVEKIVEKISSNYSFTQKIDVSIKQQESGSKQAADTMKQMAEIARQSAESSRQVLSSVKDIVDLSADLDVIVKKANTL